MCDGSGGCGPFTRGFHTSLDWYRTLVWCGAGAVPSTKARKGKSGGRNRYLVAKVKNEDAWSTVTDPVLQSDLGAHHGCEH